MRLQLSGATTKYGIHSICAPARDRNPDQLPRRLPMSRPQLKRDPLGSSTSHKEYGCSLIGLASPLPLCRSPRPPWPKRALRQTLPTPSGVALWRARPRNPETCTLFVAPSISWLDRATSSSLASPIPRSSFLRASSGALRRWNGSRGDGVPSGLGLQASASTRVTSDIPSFSSTRTVLAREE